ncbi:cyanase [Salinisphaera aquimarina]|uniref:Cyanate hydratase n=1 Tax=Salinisphaera aquimarina TaxID=2094031 RepID=A0ABV7EW83_9GAMM
MEKKAMTRAILDAKKNKGMRWDAIAEQIGMAPVWTASLALGESSATEEIAQKLCAVLDLGDDVADALMVCPLKGQWMEKTVPTDPMIYRFYEIMSVYGTSVKEVVHEEFGDGIMSAIDFTLDVEREPNPSGDRVKIVMSGKFLPYVRW